MEAGSRARFFLQLLKQWLLARPAAFREVPAPASWDLPENEAREKDGCARRNFESSVLAKADLRSLRARCHLVT
jgi:hypothetical protein